MLDLCAGGAGPLKNLAPRGFNEEEVVPATHLQQWSVGG